jgi:sirohydrochlorin ferrochelatase
MATKANIQAAIDRLTSRNVCEIVAVPLFVSSHSSIITVTEYLLGLRPAAPPQLAAYARMSHGHGEHYGEAGTVSPDAESPVKSPVPIRMSSALDSHPVVSEILLSRALSVSRNPEHEAVILVAHGPVSDEENTKWLAEMEILASRIRNGSEFSQVDFLTVRDDAPKPVRDQATAELRDHVEKLSAAGSKVLIVPLLVSFGGIEEGLRKRLEGLDYAMPAQALLPDDRLARWVQEMAGDRALVFQEP